MVGFAASWELPTLTQLHREEVPPLAVFSRGKGSSGEGRVEDACKVSTHLSTEDRFSELLRVVRAAADAG